MNYHRGLLSVVIPTYKRSEMLYRAIDSVLNQSYKNVECIVVNDNTPGDEYSLTLYKQLAKYKVDKRFRFVEQKVHKNGAAARNAGISVAEGEYIAFLDDDDYWDSNKADIQISILEKLSDEWGAVSCLMRFYRNGKIYAANLPYKDGDIHYEILSRKISMGTGSLIIRRNALDKTGYFDENLKRFQDPQIFSCLAEQYKIKLVKKYLHNRDVDDAQNRPTVETINSFQSDFFISVKSQLDNLSPRKLNILKTIFDFDKVPIYWRNGQKRQAVFFVLGVFKYPEAIRLGIDRFYSKYLMRKNIASRLEQYK